MKNWVPKTDNDGSSDIYWAKTMGGSVTELETLRLGFLKE